MKSKDLKIIKEKMGNKTITYQVDSEGRKQGIYEELEGPAAYSYVGAGTVRQFTYKDDILNGPYSVYELSGKDHAVFGNGYDRRIFRYTSRGNLNSFYQPYLFEFDLQEKGIYKDGKLEKNSDYTSIRKSKRTPYKECYESGKLKVKGTIIYCWGMHGQRSQKVGRWKVYYENGQLWQRSTFDEQSRQQGTCEIYYENGQLKAKYNYKDGIKDGPYKFYYPNGKLWKKGTYKDGERDGLYEEYDKSGKLIRRGMIKKGRYISDPDFDISTRKGLIVRLNGLNKEMEANEKRKIIKRTLISKYRESHPKERF